MRILVITWLLLVNNGCSDALINSCDEASISTMINRYDLQVYMASCNDCAPIRNIGYRVGIHPARANNYYEEIDSLRHNLSNECWMRLLNNKSSSWKANLILYCIYELDAEQLEGLTEEQWTSTELKSKDLIYWQETLSQ